MLRSQRGTGSALAQELAAASGIDGSAFSQRCSGLNFAICNTSFGFIFLTTDTIFIKLVLKIRLHSYLQPQFPTVK